MIFDARNGFEFHPPIARNLPLRCDISLIAGFRLTRSGYRMSEPDVRKGMPSVKVSRDEFKRRYRSPFADPAFDPLQRQLDEIIAAAWDAYSNSRKSPRTRKARPGFAGPGYG
jgi:hypothetical protein